MKFHVCALFSINLGCFGKPIFDDRDINNIKTTFVRNLKQGLVTDERATRLKYTDTQFKVLSTFDDETGEFSSSTNGADVIVECNDILVPKESKDGK